MTTPYYVVYYEDYRDGDSWTERGYFASDHQCGSRELAEEYIAHLHLENYEYMVEHAEWDSAGEYLPYRIKGIKMMTLMQLGDQDEILAAAQTKYETMLAEHKAKEEREAAEEKARNKVWLEKEDRENYERLKAKYEGGE